MPRRRAAFALACAIAAALQAAHTLAYGAFDVVSVLYAAITTAIELVVLSALYRRTRKIAVIGAVALGLGIVAAVLAAAVSATSLDAIRVRVVLQVGLYDGVLALGLWALAVAVPEAHARTLELERLRTAAELATLRAHVQPHFLLNTLNTIAALVTEAPDAARELIAALGDLLRDALEDRGETHTLGEEIAWLRRYAHVIEMRHGVRFRWEVSDDSRQARIPRMLLQPLVENAVKHGALRCATGGEVVVSAHLAPDHRLLCVVEDNGPGPVVPRDGALGIELVTRRLELGGHGTFRLERAGMSTRSIVELAAAS